MAVIDESSWRTLPAAALRGLAKIFFPSASKAVLRFLNSSRRNVTIEDVGNASLFLLSPLGAGVTGEVMHVDSGYHTVGMVAVDKVAENAELLESMVPKNQDAA